MQLQFRGPIIRGKTAFNLNVSGNNRYTSNNIIAVDQYGNRIGNQVRVPTETSATSTSASSTRSPRTRRCACPTSGPRSEGHNQGLEQLRSAGARARDRNRPGTCSVPRSRASSARRASTSFASSSIATPARRRRHQRADDHHSGRSRIRRRRRSSNNLIADVRAGRQLRLHAARESPDARRPAARRRHLRVLR